MNIKLMKEANCMANVNQMMFRWISDIGESVGKMCQVMANITVAVPQMKDAKNKMKMNLRIALSFLTCLIIKVSLEKAMPISKAVQAAINIVEETRIADMNAEG